MIEKRLVKVDRPDHPDRCQGVIKSGQCPFTRIQPTEYCYLHQGGSKVASINPEKAIRNYRLACWQARVGEFADSDSIKSLREEIGISRMVLENILLKCQDTNDLLLYSSKISDHVEKIKNIVVSCHKLEQATGNLLDKHSILQIASTFVEIIAKYIDDPIILDMISQEFIETVKTNSDIFRKDPVSTTLIKDSNVIINSPG